MPFNFEQPAYQRLRTAYAERRRPFAFWLGAGFSAPAGLPSWGNLKEKMIDDAVAALADVNDTEAEAAEEALARARELSNYWDSFEEIKSIMGRADFIAGIRASLNISDNIDIPACYRDVWKLPGVRAVLTLNMDGFVQKAHRRVRPHEDPVTFNGRDAPAHAHILGARRPFIANLHGILDDQTSWIFTKTDVNQLFSNSAYQDFLTMVFATMTVVFAGISADDGAAGGTLAKITERGLDLGAHYWITDKTTNQPWAARAGLQVIRYSPEADGPESERHTAALKLLFDDIQSYRSHDTRAIAVLPDVDTVTALPSPRELRSYDDDQLRMMLSGYAKGILETSSDKIRSPEYTEFLRLYSSNIHQAWHVTTEMPENVFYGYTVVRQIHSSPFSTIWELLDSNGKKLALKILRIENLRAGSQIESFRRGVQSLNYLSRADVPGTASLKRAFEIPTSVVMDYVEGSNLADVVRSRSLQAWPDLLFVMINVCNHLIFSHNLPQGVLHRDVRPSNIILPFAFWNVDDVRLVNGDPYDITLLNYDMSWHANAAGQSIPGNIEEAGYYAPEQLNADDDAARTTLVDSYGVGMSLFFAFAKADPPTGGSSYMDWAGLLFDKVRNDPRLMWRSAPARLRRLIFKATQQIANNRISVTQIKGELELLADAVQGQLKRIPVDFWAEELMSRSQEAEYIANPNDTEFVRTPKVGRTITIGCDSSRNFVIITFKNQAIDATNRGGIDRLWTEKLHKAKEIFTANGWEISDASRYAGMEILLKARTPVSSLPANFEIVLYGLKRGLDQVRIE